MEGLLLITLGAGILLAAGAYLQVALGLEPKLMRLNFPGLSRRFPRATGQLAIVKVWATVVFGMLVAVAAIVAGVVSLV